MNITAITYNLLLFLNGGYRGYGHYKMTAMCNIDMQLKDVLPVITEHYYGSIEKQSAITIY